MGSWDGLVGWAHGMGSWAPIMMGLWDGPIGCKFDMFMGWAHRIKLNGLRIKSTLNVKKHNRSSHY